jgi:hypothetical protein
MSTNDVRGASEGASESAKKVLVDSVGQRGVALLMKLVKSRC